MEKCVNFYPNGTHIINRDKSYITSISCQQSEEHFSFLKSMVNIPLILTSSIMTILNSLNETESKDLKYCNIVYEVLKYSKLKILFLKK